MDDLMFRLMLQAAFFKLKFSAVLGEFAGSAATNSHAIPQTVTLNGIAVPDSTANFSLE